MAYRYRVISVDKDNSNGNIIATVRFADPAVSGSAVDLKVWAYDLTDATIDEWARNTAAVLATRDASISGITLNRDKVPDALPAARKTLEDATKAFVDKLAEVEEAARVAALGDADLTKAYADLVAARAAVSALSGRGRA